MYILVDFVGAFYAFVLPLLVLLILSIVFIPSMMQSGAKAKNVGEAIYCYVMQATGILLMTIGGLPTIYSVLTGRGFTSVAYVGLLLVFAVGGVIFLWHDNHALSLDKASKAVPAALYFYLFKILGHLITIVSGLSLVITLVLGGSAETEWWMVPVLMFFYGLLLSWCTTSDAKNQTSMFHSMPMLHSSSMMKTPLSVALPKKAKPAMNRAKKSVSRTKKSTKRKPARKTTKRRKKK